MLRRLGKSKTRIGISSGHMHIQTVVRIHGVDLYLVVGEYISFVRVGLVM